MNLSASPPPVISEIPSFQIQPHTKVIPLGDLPALVSDIVDKALILVLPLVLKLSQSFSNLFGFLSLHS